MATIKILRECVVAHQRRVPGDVVMMDAYMARQLSNEQPQTFEWVDRPVKQFVDVTPAAPVGEDKAARRPRRKKVVDVVDAAEVGDGDESAG